MAALSPAALRRLLEPVVAATGHDLEDVSVAAAGRRSVVRVVVDADGGVDLDAVATVSRSVSDALDAADLGDAAYVLEVSSRGVDRPLTLPRHWQRNVGRLVSTEAWTGRVVEVDAAGVTVEVAGARSTYPFDSLGPGRVQVEFARHESAEEDA